MRNSRTFPGSAGIASSEGVQMPPTADRTTKAQVAGRDQAEQGQLRVGFESRSLAGGDADPPKLA